MLFHPLKNDRGLALIFMVLLFTAAAAAAVMFISLGIKIKGIQKQGTTQQRLVEIRTALQNYYLIQYDLPDPSQTNPPNSVPTDLLNLPQKYRFDSNGQLIHYDRQPASGHMTTVRNVYAHGTNDENYVAAVLVAPGPDKSIDSNNQASPYDVNVTDDVVLAVSLEAEALKIANHTVAILQQTAKAYDSIFYGINNDLDTLYYPPETRWVDLTQPTRAQSWQQTGTGPPDPVTGAPGNPIYGWINNGTWNNNYSGDNEITYVTNDPTSASGGSTTSTAIGLGDEYVEPFPRNGPFIPLQPMGIVDEDGYAPAQGGTDGNSPSGTSCVRIANVGSGIVLDNDPDRGTASLDDCRDQITGAVRDPAYGLALAYGLNLIKLGYDGSNSLLDPWGKPYLWGSASRYGGTDRSNTSALDRTRNHHYWTFFSSGPDTFRDTTDDILPPSDRIPGYFLTPRITNPIP